MSQPSGPRPSTNLSLLMGIWFGLTLAAGLGVFALLYWATGTPAPTQPASVATSQAVAVLPTNPAPAPTQAGVSGPAPVCNYLPEPPSGFAYGIQPHALVPGVNPADALGIVKDKLHLNWVKLQVRWAVIEPQPAQYDWATLDNAINASCEKGLRVMLSVVAAPDWSLAQPLLPKEKGEAPPADFQTYANFLQQILSRHPGKVQAIEVWNEANLEREWNTPNGVEAAEFARLVQVAAATIKAQDPAIIVIAGAPAPTGINCKGDWPVCAGGRTVVVDDATFLQQFIAAGGLTYVDCLGTHSNGTNLPPTADGAHPPDGAGYIFRGPWTNPHYSWALKSQVETYASILQGAKPQCVTEFGYASPLDGKFAAGYEFAQDVTEQQQASYLVEAYNWMRDSGHVKMAFLFNLNYAQFGDPATDDNPIFSLINGQGVPRPAFDAISLMDKR